MPSPQLRARGRRDALSFAQQSDLLTGIGDAFATERLRRDAWERHRSELIAVMQQRGDGERPAAFWEYDVRDPELVDPPECDWRDESRWGEFEAAGQAHREARVAHLAQRRLLGADELTLMARHAESNAFYQRLLAVVRETETAGEAR